MLPQTFFIKCFCHADTDHLEDMNNAVTWQSSDINLSMLCSSDGSHRAAVTLRDIKTF